MPVRRVNRTTEKVARAWLQAFFENDQILMPDKSLVTDYADWQAMVEGAMEYGVVPRAWMV